MRDASNNKGAANARERLMLELDKVLDIVKCKCKITLCEEDDSGCSGCNSKVHISCKCLIKERIPKLDLLWVHSQRTKIGEKSDFQMSNIDIKESKREERARRRNETKTKRHVESQMSSAEIEIDSDISDNSDTLVCETQPSTRETYLDISNTKVQ